MQKRFAGKQGLLYMLIALEGTPDLLDAMLRGMAADSPNWDLRFSLKNFTSREMLAHMADWEVILRERLERIRDEHNPSLSYIDEWQMAEERDYAHSDPFASLDRFRQERGRTIVVLQAMPADAWERPATHPTFGSITMESLITETFQHDSYQTRDTARWIAAKAIARHAEAAS